jgi:uncharacterized alpha/beta hydrolase family protein
MHKVLTLLGLLAFITIAVTGAVWMRSTISSKKVLYNSNMNPIIMVPGSSATQNRFDTLITALNEQDTQKHSQLKLTVKTDGSITYTGSITSQDRAPYIVIGFENNKDGYANIKKQGAWLNTAMNALQKRYHFRNFRAFGHSNGGLIWTNYLENYYDSDNFSVSLLTTLATPYNFEETNMNNHTQMLTDFIAKRNNIPNSMTMYSVLGTENYSDDGIVPYQSVEAGKYIYQRTGARFTQITLTGLDTQHSDLPQNPQLIAFFNQYYLQSDQQGNRRTQNNR